LLPHGGDVAPLGIPARLATGFQSGIYNPCPTSGWCGLPMRTVGEAWIPGHGWTAFDPAPDPNPQNFALLPGWPSVWMRPDLLAGVGGDAILPVRHAGDRWSRAPIASESTGSIPSWRCVRPVATGGGNFALRMWAVGVVALGV
jgi:hypothetical protein